jgi:2-succinyl-5-enolpyruvyl-6-hydroxy-3-cyclohexene-1-carboxylate synthase
MVSVDTSLPGLWARAIAEELRRGGADVAVLCPGSRNSPLLFALAAVFADDVVSVIDERAAGFLALGRIRASGRPAVVCVTSGSAMANLLPAFAEAQAAHLPLIALAADRPWELRACGAPQTMPQAGAAAGLVGREVVLGEPSADDRAIRALRARISRAVQGAGPCLVHVPLREPLLAAADAPAWTAADVGALARNGRAGGRPYTVVGPADDAAQVEATHDSRVLITAGAGVRDPQAVIDLAEHGGWPILADACSGLRTTDSRLVVCHGDALVAAAAVRPSLVIQAGDVPLARSVYTWLDQSGAEVIAWEMDGRDRDWLARAGCAVRGGLRGPDLPAGNHGWSGWWRAADQAAAAVRRRWCDAAPWSESVIADVVCGHAGWQRLVVANSMSVRHVNLHLGRIAPQRQVIVNRGLNGIDGTLGTLAGAAWDGAPTWLLVGDLAFLHDLSGLAALRRGRGSIIVVDNDGGGLFDGLTVAQHPGYRPWIRAPHGLDPGAAAAVAGIPCVPVADRDALQAALATEPDGWQIVVAHVRGLDAQAQHRALVGAMSAACPTPP